MAVTPPEVIPKTAPRREVIKRIFVGRGMATGRMEHTLLPKVLALPIFASDALSSVAYCVEASLLILLQASANVRSMIIPINLSIVLVMAIVITSYRQVVRAYPTSAGSYVVSKDNLAPVFGLIAAAALLADYVLTVAVSVSAGIVAVISASPGLAPFKIELCLGCVALLTLVNLRGVRESGVIFAVPTYGFIVSMFALIIVGVVKCIGACPQVTHVPAPYPIGTAAAASLFVILHSFASGSAALTGTEAISNGVSAFRRPQGRNASQTLAILGVIAVTMVMGTAYLAHRTNPIPSHTVSVVSEMAKVIFPGSEPGTGGVMFYAVQIFTLLILILAANTSFQGFPRLAALLARDSYIPRQFENLGDRLVYSNGMVVLAVAAVVLILVYDANVDKLLQLYVVGVFTAFTLAQTGMVRYWFRVSKEGGDKAQGWVWRMANNAVGAVCTGVVLVIVIATKFLEGAYVVIAAVAVMILGFYAVHRHYMTVAAQLRSGTVSLVAAPKNIVVLHVEALDVATAEAVGYVRSFCGQDFRAFHVEGPATTSDIVERWSSFSRTEVPLEVVPAKGEPLEAALAFVRSVPRQEIDFVTVVIPERFTKRSLLAAVRRRTTFDLKRRLLDEPQVVITDVPVLAHGPEDRPEDLLPLIPAKTEAMVFISGVHDATLRAVNYARSLKATETRAVYFAFENEDAAKVLSAWQEQRIPMALDIVEAPFRELDAPILEEVRKVTSTPNAVAVVIVPELRLRTWRYEVLHNQRALFMKRLLLFEERVILTSVPFPLG